MKIVRIPIAGLALIASLQGQARADNWMTLTQELRNEPMPDTWVLNQFDLDSIARRGDWVFARYRYWFTGEALPRGVLEVRANCKTPEYGVRVPGREGGASQTRGSNGTWKFEYKDKFGDKRTKPDEDDLLTQKRWNFLCKNEMP